MDEPYACGISEEEMLVQMDSDLDLLAVRMGLTVMCTSTILYIVELKLDKTADTAIQQIDLKNYPERFALCGLPIVKVGINFDSERRTLGDWKIKEA